LSAYVKFRFAGGPFVRDVYKRGAGPGVIVIHEMPGLHSGVIRFADRIVAAGMTVYLPNLFGVPGKPVSSLYALNSLVDALCVRREFNVWRAGKSSPIVDWLRALAKQAHADCGGRGVGAVGMCFTGGFALAMMTEPAVVAPVLSQPSMPVALGSATRGAGIDASDEEILCAKHRFEAEDLSMIGLRFKSDKSVPQARFDALTRAFGERFERIELEDSAAAPSDKPPHSVLTVHMREDGPTKAAEQRVIAFLKARTAEPGLAEGLKGAAPPS
jgi:dienelactone hydrolase